VTVGRALGLIAGLVPSAQSIRPADYLPLGQGAQWQYERTFKAIDKDDVAIVHVEATATSAADFTISKVTVTLFKREVGNKKVSGVTAVSGCPAPRSIQSRIEGRFPSSLSCPSVAPGVPDSLPAGGASS